MRYEAVLFDLDGTLVPTTHLYEDVYTRTLTEHGASLTPERFRELFVQNLSLRRWLDILEIDIALEAQIRRIRDERYVRVLREETEWMDGAEEILHRTHRTPRAIVTSSWSHYVDAIDAKLQVRSRFPEIVTANDVTKAKPHPYGLFLAAQLLDVSPDSCLYIGDQPLDILAATNAGMRSCLVRGAYTPTDADRGATIVVDSLRELKEYL